jgi:signal transduction histidine kinase
VCRLRNCITLQILSAILSGPPASAGSTFHRRHGTASKKSFMRRRRRTPLCRDELSEKTKAEVQFNHSSVPSSIPKDVSLCLFRLLQEALQNAVKHSGVRAFQVNPHGTPEGIELTVSDHGKGFEKRDAFSSRGLGLTSMRERLHMVHGILAIKTQPGAGTIVSARVPLETTDLGAKAG